jgi:hypothetical protein
MIGATQATGLDSQQAIVVTDLGQRELAASEPARTFQHHGHRGRR